MFNRTFKIASLALTSLALQARTVELKVNQKLVAALERRQVKTVASIEQLTERYNRQTHELQDCDMQQLSPMADDQVNGMQMRSLAV